MHIAGVDEAGRGPLAGDVVAAAVILKPSHGIVGLNDSKKLTEKKREALFDEIITAVEAYCIARASVQEIDELNILHATMLAMKRAVEGLNAPVDHVMVDGNRCPDIEISCEAIVKGDSKVEAISAASILAKVTRDRDMLALDKQWPEYGFAKHKGYPTALHMEKLKAHGATEHHRTSFKPVKDVLGLNDAQPF